jgi:D-hydroxyproline dehydrogenase subunit beta
VTLGSGRVGSGTVGAGSDVVVIGSGLVGACCAYELAVAGLSVTVVDRGNLTSGTTASGEGNILVSDKVPGAELELAKVSVQRWAELAEEITETLGDDIEFEPKGGVVVAADDAEAEGLRDLARRQRNAGLTADEVTGDDLHALEPHLAPDLALGVHYPQDAQVQPILASAALLRRARDLGATIVPQAEVVAIGLDGDGRVATVTTDRGSFATRWIVNAAGPWSGEVSALVGIAYPIAPRRGHILVTEPCEPLVHHKVYDAGYVGTLTADDDPAAVEVSSVVESTQAGTILLGSSREFVGYDRRIDGEVVRAIAARAVRLFPVLAGVRLMRTYVGFRPWLPDHLPAIGEDPRVPGFVQASGHEGAGIGLAPATGVLVRDLITGRTRVVDPEPFRPDRPTLIDVEVAHG